MHVHFSLTQEQWLVKIINYYGLFLSLGHWSPITDKRLEFSIYGLSPYFLQYLSAVHFYGNTANNWLWELRWDEHHMHLVNYSKLFFCWLISGGKESIKYLSESKLMTTKGPAGNVYTNDHEKQLPMVHRKNNISWFIRNVPDSWRKETSKCQLKNKITLTDISCENNSPRETYAMLIYIHFRDKCYLTNKSL